METFVTDLFKVKIVCGHHVNTDISKIKDNLKKYKIKIIDSKNIPIDNPFINIEIDDTSTLYRQIENKPMTLSKMYYALFNKTFDNAHNAMVDVQHTAECYVELLNRKCKNKLLESKKLTKSTTNKTKTKLNNDNNEMKINIIPTSNNSNEKPKRLFRKTTTTGKTTDLDKSIVDEKIIIKPQNKFKTNKPTQTNTSIKSDTDIDVRIKKPNKNNLKSSTDLNIENSENKIELFDLINNNFFK
jgi:hypothetical protein